MMKKVFFRKGLITIIIGVVVSILLPFLTCTDIPQYLFFTTDITEKNSVELDKYDMGDSEIYYSEDLVKMDVFYICDYSASNDEGVYYIVPYYNEDTYITVYVPNKYIDKFQEVYDGTYRYMNEEIDTPDWDVVSTAGVLYPIDDDVMLYTSEWFEKAGWYSIDEAKEHIVPYTLYYSDIMDWIDIAAITIIILAAVLCVISIVLGLSFEPIFWNEVKKMGYDKQTVLDDLDNGEKMCNAIVGNNFIATAGEMNCKLIETNKMMWAFLFTTTTTHKTYGIKTGTSVSYSTKITCSDGKTYLISAGNDMNKVYAMLDYLKKKFPYIAVGYSDELARLFETNKDEFRRFAQSQTCIETPTTDTAEIK